MTSSIVSGMEEYGVLLSAQPSRVNPVMVKLSLTLFRHITSLVLRRGFDEKDVYHTSLILQVRMKAPYPEYSDNNIINRIPDCDVRSGLVSLVLMPAGSKVLMRGSLLKDVD